MAKPVRIQDVELVPENNNYKVDWKSEIIKLVGVGKKKTTCLLYTPLLKRVLEF